MTDHDQPAAGVALKPGAMIKWAGGDNPSPEPSVWEGQRCGRLNIIGVSCPGVLEVQDRGACPCNMREEPCSVCFSAPTHCPTCGWEEEV